MAIHKHSKDRRKQKCAFCSQLLKYYRDIEVQTRTGWMFHIWCKQAIDLRRNRQMNTPVRDIYEQMKYITIYNGKCGNTESYVRVYA